MSDVTPEARTLSGAEALLRRLHDMEGLADDEESHQWWSDMTAFLARPAAEVRDEGLRTAIRSIAHGAGIPNAFGDPPPSAEDLLLAIANRLGELNALARSGGGTEALRGSSRVVYKALHDLVEVIEHVNDGKETGSAKFYFPTNLVDTLRACKAVLHGHKLLHPEDAAPRETEAGLREALQAAHDRMDNVNASTTKAECVWCRSEGYDGDGLKHTEDCIIVVCRAALHDEQEGEG